MLTRISEFEVEKMSISNFNNATYLQCNKQPFEIQTEWVTLGKYPLPSRKFITDDTKSINLTIPITKDDDTFIVLSSIDDNLSNAKISPTNNYHPIIHKKDNSYYLMFKIYLNTGLFDKDKNRISITSLHEFHQYLREYTKVRLVFTFSKLWKMANEYGFSLSVRRIQLADDVKTEAQNEKP